MAARLVSRPARSVVVQPHDMDALLAIPRDPIGIVIFAHGSGSSRFSARNNRVADALHEASLATLLLDLLSPEEAEERGNVFDIPLLASRIEAATDWVSRLPETARLPIGYFGASTGAGAALFAAARTDGRISAIVSRGGRPDLAGSHALSLVRAPTLLIVGALDKAVIGLNRVAMAHLHCETDLVIVPGAAHLFEEPRDDGAGRSAQHRLVQGSFQGAQAMSEVPFKDRAHAGRRLAMALGHYKREHPLILALPRGGVPVAYEVARALEADLDLLFVRKIGVPGNEEVALGAVVDGASPQLVLNGDIVREVGPSPNYIQAEMARQLALIERRRTLYTGMRPAKPVHGRTVIIVDDGIATGATVRAALRGVRKAGPEAIILAVPVAPPAAIRTLRSECDDVVCLAQPDPFLAVGLYYSDFEQTEDDEVIRLLDHAEAAARVRRGSRHAA